MRRTAVALVDPGAALEPFATHVFELFVRAPIKNASHGGHGGHGGGVCALLRSSVYSVPSA